MRHSLVLWTRRGAESFAAARAASRDAQRGACETAVRSLREPRSRRPSSSPRAVTMAGATMISAMPAASPAVGRSPICSHGGPLHAAQALAEERPRQQQQPERHRVDEHRGLAGPTALQRPREQADEARGLQEPDDDGEADGRRPQLAAQDHEHDEEAQRAAPRRGPNRSPLTDQRVAWRAGTLRRTELLTLLSGVSTLTQSDE